MSWSTYLGFPDGSLGNESACNRGEADAALIPCSGRSPRGRNGNPLQYSHLESPINRGTWWATLHRVARIQTRLSWATKLCLCSIAESVGQEVFIVFVARLGAPRAVPAVKNLPANAGALRDTGSIPGWEDPLEEIMAAHCSILSWRVSWADFGLLGRCQW